MRRRRRDGDARSRGSHICPGTYAGASRNVAEADKGTTVEWARGGAGGSALHPKISRRALFSSGERACGGSRAEPCRNDGDGGAHGNGETRKPADRRGLAAAGRGLGYKRWAGYQCNFVRRAERVRGADPATSQRTGARGVFPGGGVRAGAAAEARGSETGEDFAGVSGWREAAQGVVWSAPVRAGLAERGASCGVQARGFAERVSRDLYAGKCVA